MTNFSCCYFLQLLSNLRDEFDEEEDVEIHYEQPPSSIKASIKVWDTEFAPRCSEASLAKLRASEVKSGPGINQPTSNWLSLNLPRIIFLDVDKTNTYLHEYIYICVES